MFRGTLVVAEEAEKREQKIVSSSRPESLIARSRFLLRSFDDPTNPSFILEHLKRLLTDEVRSKRQVDRDLQRLRVPLSSPPVVGPVDLCSVSPKSTGVLLPHPRKSLLRSCGR